MHRRPNVVGWNDVRTGLDAVGFARQRLGFEPDALQAQVLQSRSKRLLLNCLRQWGKSSVCAIAALYRAWFRPGSLVVVTGPSGRTAGESTSGNTESGAVAGTA